MIGWHTSVQFSWASSMAHLRIPTACPNSERLRTGGPQLQQMLFLARHSLAVHCSARAMARRAVSFAVLKVVKTLLLHSNLHITHADHVLQGWPQAPHCSQHTGCKAG